jgi:hypothetical protein
MNPFVIILGLTLLVGLGAGIPAFVILKLARLKASGALAPGGEVAARLEALEHDVQSLQRRRRSRGAGPSVGSVVRPSD